MWKSHLRALDAVPPRSAADLAKLFPGETVALKCYTPDCKECARFDVEERAHFEKTQLRGVDRNIPWNCKDPRKRSLALESGVSSVPSYLVLRGGESTVLSTSVSSLSTSQ